MKIIKLSKFDTALPIVLEIFHELDHGECLTINYLLQRLPTYPEEIIVKILDYLVANNTIGTVGPISYKAVYYSV